MYQNVEEKCRKYTKTIASFMIFNQFPTFASLFHSFYCVAIGNRDASTWVLPVALSVPLSTAIIWQWYVTWFYCANMGIIYIYVVTLIASSFISFCLYIRGICDHFDLLIQSLQKNIKQNRAEKNPDEIRKRNYLIAENLCKTVKTQIKALT